MTATTNSGDQLRANDWDAYVGQEQLKATLQLRIDAAVAGGRMLDHVFLAAGPGMGKTTIANLIATRLGDDLQMFVAGPSFNRKALIRLLRDWEGGVLFIDEIHRLSKQQQEDLLSLTEDGFIALDNGKRMYHNAITVIGATTEPEKVIAPLLDRFPIKPQFSDYSDAEMGQIVQGMASKLGLDLDRDFAIELGQATGGTPRNARQFVLAARDLEQLGRPVTVASILTLCSMDRDGLSDQHIVYLKALHELGGVSGMDKIANMTRLHPTTLTNLERVLVSKGFIVYTFAGRELTQAGSRKSQGIDAATDSRPAPRTRRVVAA